MPPRTQLVQVDKFRFSCFAPRTASSTTRPSCYQASSSIRRLPPAFLGSQRSAGPHVYCFSEHQPHRPALPLLPCPRLRFIDYLEWLPHHGITAGWKSIRHFAGELLTWSRICGHGGIVDSDRTGYEVWRSNFEANVQITTAPRGGDLPLRPSLLRGLARVYTSDSAFDKLMLMVCSQLWFTALRVGHFSPQSASDRDRNHRHP